ncbi:unspecified product [Plasmodium ovale wallikeri]|uniref:Unspecified product n=1 Tax=Plasmodium ovale wallikeri TaxID=864142 RepID=A0A1A9AN63_PLAOA|nr:unspecified product [Plasmodium ovale wallikeri]
MAQSGRSTWVFNETHLDSNFFIETLYKDKNFDKHIKEIETNISGNNSEKIILTVNEQFKKIYNDITEKYSVDEESKCCRDINYYFDLLYSIIKSSDKLSDVNLNNVIAKIKEKWENVPKIRDKNKCKGETDLDSIRIRCILKHLQDLKNDKNFIISFTENYKTYLGEKWEKITKYINPYDKLYVKIENDFIGIIEKYSHFLESPDFICDTKLDAISIDDITISTNWDNLMNSVSLEKFTPKGTDKGCYNKNYIEILKIKASNIQRINNILSSGIEITWYKHLETNSKGNKKNIIFVNFISTNY